MKHKFLLLFFCLSLVLLPSVVWADELSDVSEPVQADQSAPTLTVVDVTQLLTDKTTESDSDELKTVEVLEPALISVEQTRETVAPSDANGFKAVLLTVLGDYETVVTDYTYQTSSSYYSHSIEIEQDYAWIASACMLGLITYCTFRIIGGMLCKA